MYVTVRYMVSYRRLVEEKERLKREKRVKEQCGVQLCGAEEGGVGGTITSQSWPK